MSSGPAIIHLNGAKGHGKPIRRGDTFRQVVRFFDDAGAPLNKAAPITWLCQLRTKPRSGQVVATFTVTVSGAGNNIVTWSLTKDETKAIPSGKYYYDLEETTPGAPVDEVVTRIEGIALCGWDVSRV